MTIVDSLKAKGSTGGNNIAEAIKNLPMGGGGEAFILHMVPYEEGAENQHRADKTYQEIYDALQAGKIIYLQDINRNVIYAISYFVFDFENENNNVYFSNATWNFINGNIDDYPIEDLG